MPDGLIRRQFRTCPRQVQHLLAVSEPGRRSLGIEAWTSEPGHRSLDIGAWTSEPGRRSLDFDRLLGVPGRPRCRWPHTRAGTQLSKHPATTLQNRSHPQSPPVVRRLGAVAAAVGPSEIYCLHIGSSAALAHLVLSCRDAAFRVTRRHPLCGRALCSVCRGDCEWIVVQRLQAAWAA